MYMCKLRFEPTETKLEVHITLYHSYMYDIIMHM